MGDDIVSSCVFGMASARFGWRRVPRERSRAQFAAHHATPYDARALWYGGVGAALPLFASAEARALRVLAILRDALSVGFVAAGRVSLGAPRTRLSIETSFWKIFRRILGDGENAEKVEAIPNVLRQSFDRGRRGGGDVVRVSDRRQGSFRLLVWRW